MPPLDDADVHVEARLDGGLDFVRGGKVVATLRDASGMSPNQIIILAVQWRSQRQLPLTAELVQADGGAR